MRLNNLFFVSWATVTFVLGSGIAVGDQIQRRDDGSASALPTLGSGKSASSSASPAPSPSGSNTQSSNTVSITASPSPSISGSSSGRIDSTQSANITSSILPTSSLNTILPTSSLTASTNATANATSSDDTTLPLQPQITPAFAISGVVLILTGLAYLVIGVKNRLIHIFLSTGYLTSLSITVLIVYVLNPPVSNAIQGAYFVGIFMTGVIFGGGALIFKEVTEGLGCLLGGFCVSMWFLTLKEGGLITSTGGKAVFISVFCVVAWSLSFSHYTRTYGLMVSIAFSGSTAFVLGIDCFSRGGLKEFWVYLWNLNNNIFPLNTNTYPISRGTRVETIVIVLATIIGIISQMKLWKVVKDRQKQREEVQSEESRRREAVEAALGRHLERQNDRDRSEWEKQYGSRLNAKRETVLWTDAHGEKGYSKIKETEINGLRKSASAESLELSNMPKKPRSMYVTRIKRSSTAVDAIPEVEETEATGNKTEVRQQVLDQLEGIPETFNSPHGSSTLHSSGTSSTLDDTKDYTEGSTRVVSAALSTTDGPKQRNSTASKRKSVGVEPETLAGDKRASDYNQYLAAPEEEPKKKRRSFASFLSRSKDEDLMRSASQSQEALVVPETSLHHSRASSLAATLDFENETLELPTIDVDFDNPYAMPEIVVSPVETIPAEGGRRHPASRGPTPEPELAEETYDADPEEFVRPATVMARTTEQKRLSSGTSAPNRRQSGSEFGGGTLHEDGLKAKTAQSEIASAEVLTKDALELMPSQLSHVVLSYRTNEWAKHIATADAPVVEEPDQIEEHETEAPTHLADPRSLPGSKRSSLNQSIPLPPEVPAPVPSALPSSSEGIRINPALQYEQAPISAIVQPTQSIQPARVRSTSDANSISHGLRSSSTPMLVKQGLQSTPIEGNTPANFVPNPLIVIRSASSQSLRNYAPSNSTFPARPSAAVTNAPSIHGSVSRLSMVSENGVVPARSNSMLSYQHMPNYAQSFTQSQTNLPYHLPTSPYQQQQPFQPSPTGSATRLPYYDSHQPLRRNESLEQLRREAMFADWRATHAQRAPIPEVVDPEHHRRQMLLERHHIKLQEEQEKNFKFQQEMAVDARMRSKDMQELHREAMRRMQANANKKI